MAKLLLIDDLTELSNQLKSTQTGIKSRVFLPGRHGRPFLLTGILIHDKQYIFVSKPTHDAQPDLFTIPIEVISATATIQKTSADGLIIKWPTIPGKKHSIAALHTHPA